MRKTMGILISLTFVISMVHPVFGESKKPRIFVVSSYHREYLWSQDTHAGVCAGLRDFGFFDNEGEVKIYTDKDFVEGKKVVVRKSWMDAKRKTSRDEIMAATARVVKEIEEFAPDLILLGDDDAANYVGNHYVDTNIPVVFWGINGSPLKYGLIDSIERPGHNVTGIFQAGYLRENLEYMKKLIPDVKTFAILSDDSSTGRSKTKEIERLAKEGTLPMKHVGTVMTDSFTQWKVEALKLQKEVDAFFVLNHNTLKDEHGNPVDQLEAGAWYLRNIKKPDCGHERQFAQEGLLLVVDDSGFKQGYEAVKTAHMILNEGKTPGDIPVRAPERGPIIVNRQRAEMLGVDVSNKPFVEEFIDDALALKQPPE